jgi:tRNA (guanine-N7-)-methyltransferase
MSETTKPLRSIRSFVRREGHITPAQLRALKDLWPRYGIEAGEALIDFDAVFERRAPVILEIGFGNGDALAAEAAAHPEINYIGIEVHRPGIGNLLRKLESSKLKNVRVMLADAMEVLTAQIPEDSLAGVRLFFPDPWPKQRHHKRRLVQPDFAALVKCRLVPGGYIHLVTDSKDYAEHMASVLSRTPSLVEVSRLDQFTAMIASRGPTRFEQRGRQLGNQISDLVFQRTI